ncbi:MAG TPA: hypothetical protein PLI01_00405 [Nitrospira sp.]|nr:hypothetical protein [Nitrospira sp.]HNA25220.1 hypothetical protein [Nitrospira sp.]HNI17510.1 hypothetical protein [Nitrospira sp.]
MIYRRSPVTGRALSRFPVAGTVITTLGLITTVVWFATQYKPVEAAHAASPALPLEVIALTGDLPPCTLDTSTGIYDCTDPARTVELHARMQVRYTLPVTRTRYSRADSCHYPSTINGKSVCLTAAGRDTVEGVTVACPRSLKLGTRVRFQGEHHIYTCEDRYSRWVDAMRDRPTIDVFAEAAHLSDLPAREDVTLEVLY